MSATSQTNSACGENAQLAGGPRARLPEQARLADPGRPFDHDEASLTASRRLDTLGEDRQLVVALE